MRRVLHTAVVLTPLLIAAASSRAQSLADQITAVELSQTRQRAAQQAALAAREQEASRIEEHRQTEIRQARRAQLEAQSQIAVAARLRAEKVNEEVRKKTVEAAADKKRDQNYDDKLRDIDVETKRLQLEAMKTRVSRENDFIDRDLQRQGAETDTIQSHADSNRNMSAGMKTLLEKTGEAGVHAASQTTSAIIVDPPINKSLQQSSR